MKDAFDGIAHGNLVALLYLALFGSILLFSFVKPYTSSSLIRILLPAEVIQPETRPALSWS